MNKLRVFFADIWQPMLTAIFGLGSIAILLGYRLGSITPGFSATEVNALQGIGSLRAIAENPLFLPYKFGQYILVKLDISLPIVIRGVSALIGFFCVWGFYLLLKRWHTRRTAVFGAMMFATSTLFLTTARSATPTILYVFNILSIIFIAALVYQKKASKSSLLLAAVCSALLVYSPGMVWLLVIGIVWQYKGVISLLKQNPVWLWVSALTIFGVLLIPAGYALYTDPSFALKIAGIPSAFVPLEMLKRILIIPTQLFIQGPAEAYWLARVPVMDIFSGTMVMVGFYSYYLRYKLSRTKFLIWISVILVALIAAFAVPTVTVLPIVYILVAAGITLLLQQWLTVFPLNPLARFTGIGIVTLAVLAASWFQASRYFIAWRNNQNTIDTYSLRLQR